MISNWKYDYSNEEKGLALTILNLNEEIKKLVDEAEEQDRHIKEANIEIERLNNIINELEKYIDEDDWTSVNGEIAVRLIKLKLQELK